VILVIPPETRFDVCVLDWKGPTNVDPFVDIAFAVAADDFPLARVPLRVARQTGNIVDTRSVRWN
jgi:hypothetical protein